jgi:THO complex subunit 4
MQSTVGPVKFVQLNFNSAGKSTGVATVLFKAKGDGNKAHAACEDRLTLLTLKTTTE